MTMTLIASGPRVSQALQAALQAARELRDAKAELRRGNVIRGVQRHENAKHAMYQAARALSAGEISAALEAFWSTSRDFLAAYDRYRRSGTDSRAALALAQAERSLIGELDRLEGGPLLA
ncbi:hypothetical protein HNR42_002124 [Deinobacterium chartae]|uniref:Uncharacterized protein n=1 Tax=Deinobacterium chartae TaxID=521158 RepID=A0A841I2T9_9DEIO|nr:hypothetical protein [Deinobacterium chartae]MBB6098689.1 hypothetical protein [Deinobacterium chartae]